MTADLRQRLQESLGNAFTLERELSGGGMSRVFLATESRLHRKVVVKALEPRLAEGVSADRFEREITLAARLSHPNIVPVLTAGDADGVPYYTMPYVEGESLRARLDSRGVLPLVEAVGVLRDVARALAYAHERGIVHRDIKPGNVLLAGDAAVVTDFGIAKALSAARSAAGAATLTDAGITLGTPAYMAPEQASGDPATDFRADIYAFGCLAYELISGQPPFELRSPHQLLAAHLSEEPPDLRSRSPDCPRTLALLFRSCLEKTPANRPRSAREILHVLDGMSVPERQSDTPRRNRRLAIVLAVLLAGVLAFVLLNRQTRVNSASRAAPVGVRSVAVLPFANVGGDTADAYLADGLAEELATALSKVQGVRVVARHSAFRSGGREVDPREVGRVLGVETILTGTVRRAGKQMRLTVRLTRAGDGSLVWSEQYQREVRDVFEVQDEIARAILNALLPQISSTTLASRASPGAARGTSSLEAWDLYLRGQFNLRRRGSHVARAAANFEEAIARDSGFARAYSGLAQALELFPYFMEVSPDSVHDQAVAAARRALALDSTLAEAHTALALAAQHAFDWTLAEAEYRRAIVADPNDPSTRMHYARFLTYTSRTGEALEQVQIAKALDPYSAVIAGWVSAALRFEGDLAASTAEAARAMELDSVNPGALPQAAFVFLAVGRPLDARRAADRIPRTLPHPWPGVVAYVRAASGDRNFALRFVTELETRPSRPWGAETALAWALLGVGDSTRALDALTRAADAGEMWPSNFSLLEPMYDLVRRSPRFAALIRRFRLDPVAFTSVPSRPARDGGRPGGWP